MPSLAPLQDEIELRSPSSNPQARSFLVYFIPGNPGLVEYYRRYLLKLQTLLLASPHYKNRNIIISSSSHDGFELDPSKKTRINSGSPPFSLEEEVDSVKTKLSMKARQIAAEEGNDDSQPLDVILIAHSVGSYILLDLLSWYQSQPSEQSLYKLKAGVCLFPTVVEMLKSQKGQQIGWFITWEFAGHVLSGFARFVNWLGVLDRVARVLTPGTEGAKVTAALARSEWGVRQVIHMARDELAAIRHDKWDAARVWGVLEDGLSDMETSTGRISDTLPNTRLYFIFGKDDYWVDNESREMLIEARGSKGTHATKQWPRMDVLHDRPEIPHTFSLHPEYSDHIAEKTADWILGLLDES